MKRLFIFTIVFILFLLTGCVNVSMQVKLLENGKVEETYVFSFDQSLISIAAKEEGVSEEELMTEMMNQFRMEMGNVIDEYNITEARENGVFGIKVSKTHESLEAFKTSFNNIDQAPIFIEKETGFFYDSYKLSSDFSESTTEFVKQMKINEFGGVENFMWNQIAFDFTLSLPAFTNNHNANQVLNDGDFTIYKWDLMDAMKTGKNIELEAKQWNWSNIFIPVVGLTLVVAGVVTRLKQHQSC